ncbi:hypothetical protein L1080_033375 [Rhodococcus sp. MSC1_016]|uniref:hypothetical protein n=1 Tax=Rhodococcus sp. MSC1_016 TaxID=2909266 RepID=UPI00202FAF8A|nr:hypothetical protein [Rhodococcus sp. MSC1_016]
MARIMALAAVIMAAASCSTAPQYPGANIETLPANAVGAVSLGGLTVESSGGRTLVFVFDESGNVVGRMENGRVDGNQVVASHHNVVTASSRAVTTLTDTARIDTPITEHTVASISNNPDSGATTIWFNSGRSNNYVSVSAEHWILQGSVPGMVRTTAYCGDRHFAVVDNWQAVDAPIPNRLYELPPGGELVVRGEWDSPSDYGPASRTSVCSPDGQSILALYGTYRYGMDETVGPAMTLVTIDVVDGSRIETPLVMPEARGGVIRGTMAVMGDRLFWLNEDADVLSVPVAGSPTVTHEWTIPEGADATVSSVSGSVVTAVNYKGRPVFSQYDLLTGNALRDPIELPWLESIVGSPAGDTTYAISSVTATP